MNKLDKLAKIKRMSNELHWLEHGISNAFGVDGDEIQKPIRGSSVIALLRFIALNIDPMWEAVPTLSVLPNGTIRADFGDNLTHTFI